MYTIYESLRNKLNKSDRFIAKEIGINPATLSHWKTGRSTPKTEVLQKLADYFGVSLQYLTTGKDDKFPLPDFDPDYIKVISLYGKLDDADKATVINLMESLSKKG